MKDDCHLYAQSLTAAGYGQVYLRKEGRKSINGYAHRLVWEAANGPIPDGMEVCHYCDEPSCINLEHLFLGTHKDNMQDAFQKGRMEGRYHGIPAKGTKLPQAKLTEEDITPIRLLTIEGLTQKQIAGLYGVVRQTISRIIRRVDWRHVGTVIVSCSLSISCARTDLYYPPDGKSVVVDERGRVSRHHNRAVVLNGSDSLGNTTIEVHRDGVRYASAGGIDNSTSTREGYRTVRFGIAAAAWTAGAAVVASQAANAYGANQAASSASNAAASKAASSTAATQAATKVQLAEIQARSAAQAVNAAKAVPAAGSTIQSTIPATVVPVP